MNKELGIDLGTSYMRICQKGRGIIRRAPMVVAVDRQTRGILAIGNEAKRMLGKTPSQILAYRPMHDGAIADCDVLPRMLNLVFENLGGGASFTRPSVIVGIPCGATEVERRAVEDAVFDAGARAVALAEEPVAAAIGSGLRMSGSRGCMVVDCGGGTTEVALLSLGGIVKSRSLRLGGDDMDDSIIRYMKEERHILIGEITAETLKKHLGSALPETDRGSLTVHGRDLNTGLAATVEIKPAEIRHAISEEVRQILDVVKNTLEESPPELSADLFDYGIMLTGGLAQLPGLDKAISKHTHVRVTIARHPMDSTCMGLGRMLGGAARDLIRYRSK